jgi:hypothetical protein
MQGITNWAGTIWGTNRGTLLAQFEHKETSILGGITLIEPGMGATHARLSGTWDENHRIIAKLDQFTVDSGAPLVLPKVGELRGVYDPATSLIQGEWKTEAGTSGQFVAIAGLNSNQTLAAPTHPQQPLPPQQQSPSIGPLVTTTLTVGTVRLDRDALANLARITTDGLNLPFPVVNAIHNGREYRHLGMESLLNEAALPGFAESVIVGADERAAGTGERQVFVRLMKDGPNTVFVAGYDRIWVEGKARQIELFLQNCESKIIGFWRNYGVNLNGVVFLALLCFLPGIPSIRNRFVVVAVVFVFLTILRLTWAKVVNTRVILNKEFVPWHIRNADWILTPLAVIFTGIVAYLIQRFVPGAR